MPNFPRYGYGVVGQLGFFENFTVRFDYAKQELELKPRTGSMKMQLAEERG